MRLLAIICLLAVPAAAADLLEAFGLRWQVPIAADWKLEKTDNTPTLHLLVPRPSTQPRRPTQFALAETPDYIRVTVEAEMKKEPAEARKRRTSLIIVYAYRDADHFNYVHFSVDSGEQQPVHNGFFHVYGGDRVRMSPPEGPATLTGEHWHKVKLVYDGTTGLAEAFVDGKTSPAMRAVDLSLKAGKVGIGSFFDLGSFRNVKIIGEPAK